MNLTTGDEMKQLEKKIEITYRWWRSEGSKIKPKHIEALNETAIERIQECMKDGYTSGQLLDTVRMDGHDGEDGTEYEGWWEAKEN